MDFADLSLFGSSCVHISMHVCVCSSVSVVLGWMKSGKPSILSCVGK
jgi:hypothetical protein